MTKAWRGKGKKGRGGLCPELPEKKEMEALALVQKG
jgi:hypothetical protein